jgi:cell division protein FtsW
MNKDIGSAFDNAIKLWWRRIDQQIILALIILFVFSIMLVTTSGSAVAARIALDEH